MFSYGNPFSFSIVASDAVSFARCDFTILPLSVNHPPVISPSSFSIPRYSSNGTYIGSVNAYDVDTNQTLSFSLSGISPFLISLVEVSTVSGSLSHIVDFFRIDSASGLLFLLNDAIFQRDIDNVILQVTVFDDGVPSRNASSSLIPSSLSLVLPSLSSSQIPFLSPPTSSS